MKYEIDTENKTITIKELGCDCLSSLIEELNKLPYKDYKVTIKTKIEIIPTFSPREPLPWIQPGIPNNPFPNIYC
jgi:hypothetical protein